MYAVRGLLSLALAVGLDNEEQKTKKLLVERIHRRVYGTSYRAKQPETSNLLYVAELLLEFDSSFENQQHFSSLDEQIIHICPCSQSRSTYCTTNPTYIYIYVELARPAVAGTKYHVQYGGIF